MQKYPNVVEFGRHGETTFTSIDRREIPGYEQFLQLFNEEFDQLEDIMQILKADHPNPFPTTTLERLATGVLAQMHRPKFKALLTPDPRTPLTQRGKEQWEIIGRHMHEHTDERPEVIIASDYDRVVQSAEALTKGCPSLADKVIFDGRVREQGMGMRVHFGDPRLYSVFNAMQAWDFKRNGLMDHEHHKGENMRSVISRGRNTLSMISRRFGGVDGRTPMKRVLVLSHHRFILGVRFLLEEWGPKQLEEFDLPANRPPTASITRYKAVDGAGKNGYAEQGWLTLNKANITFS